MSTIQVAGNTLHYMVVSLCILSFIQLLFCTIKLSKHCAAVTVTLCQYVPGLCSYKPCVVLVVFICVLLWQLAGAAAHR